MALLGRAGTTVISRAESSSLGRPRCRPAQWSAASCQPPRTPPKPRLARRRLRGMFLTSKNRLAEGRFGPMFKRLPAFAPSDDLLTNLAKTMVEDQSVPDDNHLNTSPVLFAGFTFIGQFLDHDITLDTTPLDLQQADPDATVNFRTARYDLDSVYGRGPVNDP